MSKIGRNDPCPCGSGKKYKKCHMNQDDISGYGKAAQISNDKDFYHLIKTHNSIQIIGLLGALQLYPVNHGRNFRFEQMAREVLLQFNPEDKRPTATWDKLKTVIENYDEGISEEDPLTNAFTETAIFEEGNYIVTSGIYAGFTDILNCLIECIFLQKNNLGKDYLKVIRNAVGLLLFMSNNAMKDAGNLPHLYEKGTTRNIELPEHKDAVKYTDAIYFSKTYLNAVCGRHKYDYSIISDFILKLGSPELNDDDPENNVVNFKPLLEVQDDIILYMPGGIVNALIDFIYKKAKEHNCYDKILELLYDRQFHLTQVAFSKMKWWATDIKLPEQKMPLPIKETVFQFDNQKLAYVCYIETGKTLKPNEPSSSTRQSINPYEERTKQVVGYLGNINNEQPINVFCLYIIGEAAQDYFFAWSKPDEGNQSLALKYSELLTIAYSANVDKLTLWKFAKCYTRTNELTRVMSIGGALDAYAIYLENNGSLLYSDDARPLGGMLMIVNGSSDNFKREIQLQRDEHAIPIFYKGRLAYAKVSRYKQYAPIFIEREISKEFRIAIETYKMPIWITNYQTKANDTNWATYLCEAVAFWLHKMKVLLSGILNKQTFVQFEIELSIDEKLLTEQEYEIKEIPPEHIEIALEVIPPRVRLTIPFDFLYLVKLSDNTADKLLMTSILKAVLLYIETAGKTIELNNEIIDQIVETVLQPPQAKMVLFSDASLNVKMDNRKLPGVRYIQDSDVSYILDNLVSYLQKGYAISVKIPDKKDKIKLCNDIFTALTAQITNRLEAFDGQELLNWLIRANEKCIQVREFREITVPAKIACFSNEKKEMDEILDKDKNLVTIAHATRTLIEFIATKIPVGRKWPNYDDIDELLALTNQLTEWGALNEAIRLGLDDPEMGLLPSGRIGTDKTIERHAFKPYAIARTESEIFRNIEDFDSNYAPGLKRGQAVETEESRILDAAFKAEFGITLTLLSKIIGALIKEGFKTGEPCVKIESDEIINILGKIEEISKTEINIALDSLVLLERENINIPPDGYRPSDIFPWRYNRSLSYLRRPVIRIKDDSGLYYYYGYRHLMVYFDNLLFLLDSAKLPNPVTKPMITWLAGISGEKGNPFRKRVKEWFKENTDFEVIDYEVKMDVDGHLKTDKSYGDIDLMVIDHNNRIVYLIECKNITGGRNVHEMKVEMDAYLGRDGNDRKAKIRKHVERDEWVQKNKSALLKFGAELDSYSVQSIILTADEIPLSYLKDNLPLPVKSFVFLRKKGISLLKDL